MMILFHKASRVIPKTRHALFANEARSYWNKATLLSKQTRRFGFHRPHVTSGKRHVLILDMFGFGFRLERSGKAFDHGTKRFAPL